MRRDLIEAIEKAIRGRKGDTDALEEKIQSAGYSMLEAIFALGEASGIRSERKQVAAFLRTLRMNARANVKSLADSIERGDHERPNP